MNTVFHEFNLDLNDIHSGVFVGIKAGDTGHGIRVNLHQGFVRYDIADRTLATLRAKLPSGSVVTSACTIADNEIECEIGSNMTSAVGMVECEITMTGDGKSVTTPTFVLVVESKLN